MKKVLLLLAILFMLVGCSSKKEEVKVETFLNEQYLNFPEVKKYCSLFKEVSKGCKSIK